MNEEMLKEAVSLADEVGYAFVATTNEDGLPHMASAGKLTLDPQQQVVLAEWFCPRTVSNVRENQQIALVVWDVDGDIGYQLLGKVQDMREVAMLDGYAPDEEEGILPQVERELLISVNEVLSFSQGPHTDTPQ